MNKLRIFFSILVLLISTKINASHLTGGDISYRCIGGGQYEVTLTIYRDDYYANAQATLDAPASISIFNRDNNAFVRTEDFYLQTSGIISNNTNPCISSPPGDIRIQKGVYKKTISLVNNTNGYTIVYQRCCRNNAILNLQNDPVTLEQVQGMTVAINIPANSLCNSSPVFNDLPPLFLCINSRQEYNMSATDADGNQLKYSLCAPLQGLDPNDPIVNGTTLTRAESPPYDSVVYNNGYNSIKPLGATSTININPNTGLLTIVPKVLGKFVIGICVQEIRNSVVLSTTIRDFQVNVENCAIPSAIPIVITSGVNSPATMINDSTFSNCQGTVVNFDNDGSQNGVTYFWDFGDPSKTNDTSIAKNPSYTYADTGTYYITLIVNKGKPCSDTSRIKVFYYPGLVPNFTYVPKCQNELLQLIDSTKSVYNDVSNWKWILSAGDTSYIQNPTKLFTTPGTYNIQLFASTSRGCVGKVTKSVTINPKPVANFTANYLCYKNSSVFTDASSISTGSITKYLWAFGDGTADSLKNTTHVYNTFADSFSVKHIVTSALGCKDSITKKIKMDDTVKISYTTTPTALCEKSTITFTNTSTGGNPTGFQWIINNGTTVSGNTTTASFPNSGIFPVQLIATNRCGKDTLKSTINIKSNPVVNLGSDITVCNKSTKTLTAIGVFDSIRWNTAENTPTITLNGNKSPINITVYKNGCVGRDTVLVKKQTITPNFNNNFLCLNKPIFFNNTSTVNFGNLIQYDWSFGDGNTSNNIQSPIHSYSTFGNYNIQLIATSDIGCKDTIVKNVAMDSVLQVNFTTSEVVSCQRKAVDFINLTKGGFNNLNVWRIENNNYVSKDKSYTFLGFGIYPVKLVVSNRCYEDSISKNIQVRPRPNVYIGRDTFLCKNQTTNFTINPSPYDSIRWINGSNATTVIADGSINPFKIKVYLDQCAAEDTVVVAAPKFNLNFTNDFLCYNKPITFTNTSSVTIGSISNYNWNFGDGQTANNIKNPTHTYGVFGSKNIQLIATGNVGACKDTLNKTILMDDSITFNINPIPTDVCYGKSVQYKNLSTGGYNTTYVWNLNNTNPQTTIVANYTHTHVGNNVIKLTASSRCGEDSTKYSFVVFPLPKVNLGNDSIIMCPGEVKMIGINATSDSIFWSTGERDVDSITINGLISPIKVDVYNKGCLSKDSIFVSTNCDIFIPTAFSPNGDGINDDLNMINKSIKSYSLKIFDRWGELVFETNNLSNSWNGTYKGQPCLIDSYIYIVSGIKSNNETFYLKGIVSLFR